MASRDLWVDFNMLDEHDQVCTLAEFADPSSALHPGDPIIVGDDEGNTAKALVLAIRENGTVTVQVHRSTFLSRDPAEQDALFAFGR